MSVRDLWALMFRLDTRVLQHASLHYPREHSLELLLSALFWIVFEIRIDPVIDNRGGPWRALATAKMRGT